MPEYARCLRDRAQTQRSLPSTAEKVERVVEYRPFRNTDPPALAEIWNEAFLGRGAVRLRHSAALENSVYSKVYFERDGVTVGFVHAGFGPNDAGTALDRSTGVVCAIGVKPSYRGRGIGTELLRRAEAYLASRGARTILAGPQAPWNPFYFSLYGGSNSPGFLESDPDAGPFLSRHGYTAGDVWQVLHRPLNQPLQVVDTRFVDYRRRFEVQISPRTASGTWWQECVLGPIEPVEFRLIDKTDGQVAARATVWEMEGFSWRWNQPSVGLLDVAVPPERRRQGLAKFLLVQMVRYLQDQFFGIVETQTCAANTVARALFDRLGFQPVDTGHLYRKSVTGPATSA